MLYAVGARTHQGDARVEDHSPTQVRSEVNGRVNENHVIKRTQPLSNFYGRYPTNFLLQLGEVPIQLEQEGKAGTDKNSRRAIIYQLLL
jgi:hypothetical protein